MQLRKQWLKETSRGQISTLPLRVIIKTRSADPAFVYMSPANLQEGWICGTTGQGCISHSTVYKHFWLLHHLVLLRRVWHHDLFRYPFQVIDCTGSTPSTSSHWTETPTIFLSLHRIFPVSKQSPWSEKDPKHNTIVQVTLIWRGIPAFFGHTAPASAEGTLPDHQRR